MKKSFLIVLALAAITTATLIACQPGAAGTKIEKPVVISKDSLVKRGSYLVYTMLCDDCHSPKRMGLKGPEIIPELRLSGARQDGKLPPLDVSQIEKGWTLFNEDFTSIAGAWGVSFAGNLTSDETGIGNWTEEQFKKAITKGKYKGLDNSRDLLPPMPWPQFSILNDADIKAIYTFLKSTRPVRNIVPAPKKLTDFK
ncbi:c-type cytochrome [Terrimonas alba]|uniref:c-type cytochrome n=1 Tax=Terrimonas alba TaxID=3349636 RepID=UPI0035F4592E